MAAGVAGVVRVLENGQRTPKSSNKVSYWMFLDRGEKTRIPTKEQRALLILVIQAN